MSFPFVCRIFTGFGFTEVEYNRRLANSFIEIIINIIETINIIQTKFITNFKAIKELKNIHEYLNQITIY